MSRHPTPTSAGIFSARVITDEILSEGQSKLLEARRAVAASAFAQNAGRAVQSEPLSLPRTTPVISARPVHQTGSPHLGSPTFSPETSTFTYANGTFSINARQATRFRTHLRAASLRQVA